MNCSDAAGFRVPHRALALAWAVFILVREAAAQIPPTLEPAPLTNIQQITEFGFERARIEHPPVSFDASVTFLTRRSDEMFVHDATGGVVVRSTSQFGRRFAGQRVRVRGTLQAGLLAPFIAGAHIESLGSGPMPEPLRVPLERLHAGDFPARWVEINGVIRDVVQEEDFFILFVRSRGLRIPVFVVGVVEKRVPVEWLDAPVTLHGVAWPEVDREGKHIGTWINVAATNLLSIGRAPGADPFAQRTLAAGTSVELRRQSDARLKVSGTVTHASPGGRVFLRDETGAAQAQLLVPLVRSTAWAKLVQRPALKPLQPGDRIELIGAPSDTSFAPLLIDAEYRTLDGKSSAPSPSVIDAKSALTGQHDCELVTLRAKVVGHDSRTVGKIRQEVLALEDRGVFFELVWETAGTNALAEIPENTVVNVTGICSVLPVGTGPLRNFRLLLRTPDELQVLGDAPWWASLQPGRVLAVSGGLGALALVWIWTLRRRVSGRTEELAAANTQLKQAGQELLKALAQEKELGELKGRFVSMVSHEFRTPLGIIMSSAEILEAYLDRLPPAERAANLKDISDATRHMAAMMEEVLLLSRAGADKMTCRPVPLNLAALCQRIVNEVTAATNARCPIVLNTLGRLANVHGDEALLRHIFTNLLQNAVKYSPEGAPVDFTVEANGALAIFTMRDQGIGIPEADAKQLFHAFHRGRNVGDIPGSGLGMTIVKSCVELHHGKIAFESREAHGSKFIVALPLFGPAGESDNGCSADTTHFIRATAREQNLTLIP